MKVQEHASGLGLWYRRSHFSYYVHTLPPYFSFVPLLSHFCFKSGWEIVTAITEMLKVTICSHLLRLPVMNATWIMSDNCYRSCFLAAVLLDSAFQSCSSLYLYFLQLTNYREGKLLPVHTDNNDIVFSGDKLLLLKNKITSVWVIFRHSDLIHLYKNGRQPFIFLSGFYMQVLIQERK